MSNTVQASCAVLYCTEETKESRISEVKIIITSTLSIIDHLNEFNRFGTLLRTSLQSQLIKFPLKGNYKAGGKETNS